MRKSAGRVSFIAFAAALCGLVATPNANAQDTPAEASTASEDEALPELVVTAERREGNLQSVPIAVTTISAETAQALGIRTVTDIQIAAPSLNWGASIGGANISIRGISGTGSAGDESANAVYVDGVYNPVGVSLLFSLNNIERIEVDKGPQGTLFGRNASGGAVQIMTRDPEHEFSADLGLTAASYETYEGSLYLTGGISDNLAADLAIFYSDQGHGWGTNVTDGSEAYLGENYSLRTKWLWTPTTATTVRAIYSHNHVQAPALNGGTQVLPGENRPYYGFYNVSSNFSQVQKAIQDNASVEIRQDLGWATFVSITSFDYVDQPLRIDADFRNAFVSHTLPDYETWSRTYTQEFQLLSSPDSLFDWVAGLYYLSGENYRRQSLEGLAFAPSPGVPGTLVSEGEAHAISYAGYGQVTVPITDRTRLTGGLRYTVDERDIEGYTLRNGDVLPPGPVDAFIDDENIDREVTWRASIDHDLTDAIMAYASVTRGFKSGFYNISNPSNPVVQPQVVDAYEIGLKTQLFDRRVRVNISAFHYDFEDIQVRRNIATGPIFLNAARGEIDGIDIDMQARPIPELELQAGLTYLDGTYTDFPGAPYFAVAPGGGIVQLPDENAAGNRLVRSPELAASFGAQYTIGMGSAGDFIVAGNAYYNDGFFFDPQNRVGQPSYTLFNASLTWEMSEDMSIMLWGNNLGDEEYFTQIDVTLPHGDNYFPAEPATYGVTVRRHF